jgi:anaerobic magnesium-protoporphyrin IX monomethyl ester cyclase
VKRIVLFNPPGNKRYIRDYFCAKVAKSNYYYHPMDLVYLSGTLSTAYEVSFVDAIADGLSEAESIDRIAASKPDWVLFLTAGISYKNDMGVISRLHDSLENCSLIATGDIYREIGASALEEFDFIDAIVLDFSTKDVLTYLEQPRSEAIANIIHKHEGKVFDGGEQHVNGRFTIPMPRWDLINLEHYSYPFERRKYFASMLTDFGCAYKCTYCPISTIGFKLRDVDTVVEEIQYLRSRGVKDIYFRDQTFGVNKKRTAVLCERLAPLGIGWTCFTRVDVLTAELLEMMKKGGCHTVMFGIETVNEELLHEYKKDTTMAQVREAIALCKANGLDVVGFFIIGLPGDTKSAMLATIEFAKTSGIDFASFNRAMPRLGTTLRSEAIEAGYADPGSLELDSSSSETQWTGQHLSNAEITMLHKKAFRSFYLRPGYILKRLRNLSTFHQFTNFAREGLAMFLK